MLIGQSKNFPEVCKELEISWQSGGCILFRDGVLNIHLLMCVALNVVVKGFRLLDW